MIEVIYHRSDEIDDSLLRFAVIAARYEDHWVFCRHKERTTWEIPGGHRECGESIETAARRELFEETGISAREDEFEFLGSDRNKHAHYDFYCLKRQTPMQDIVLLPSETDGAKWVSMDAVHEMIRKKQICRIIANQFLRQEPMLRARQTAQE